MSLVQDLNPKEHVWDMLDKKDSLDKNAADSTAERKWCRHVSMHQKFKRIFTVSCGIHDMMSWSCNESKHRLYTVLAEYLLAETERYSLVENLAYRGSIMLLYSSFHSITWYGLFLNKPYSIQTAQLNYQTWFLANFQLTGCSSQTEGFDKWWVGLLLTAASLEHPKHQSKWWHQSAHNITNGLTLMGPSGISALTDIRESQG